MAEENVFGVDLVSALSALSNPEKDKENPFLKNGYVSLFSALTTVKPVLSEYNLALVQIISPGSNEEPPKLVTRLSHVTGEFIEDQGIPLYCKDKTNPQAMASCITYARRYGLLTLLGLVGEEESDDDASAATAGAVTNTQKGGSNAKPVEKKAAPKAQPPISQDEKKKLGGVELPTGNAFFDEHFPKLSTHEKISIHERWNKQYEPQINKLKKENPELHTLMGLAFTAHQNDLLNKTEGK
jgi:hypothetical protein